MSKACHSAWNKSSEYLTHSCSNQILLKIQNQYIKLVLNNPPFSYPNLNQDLSKKDWNLVICDNMDGPWGYYAKWHKTEKDKILYDLTYMWNIKKQTNPKFLDTDNRSMVARGWGWGAGEMGKGDPKIQTSGYKISHGDVM